MTNVLNLPQIDLLDNSLNFACKQALLGLKNGRAKKIPQPFGLRD